MKTTNDALNDLGIKEWDVTDHLKTIASQTAYLQAALDEHPEDAEFIARVLGDIARARSMAKVAEKTKLSRESLYKALSGERDPRLSTILKAAHAMGFKLQVTV